MPLEPLIANVESRDHEVVQRAAVEGDAPWLFELRKIAVAERLPLEGLPSGQRTQLIEAQTRVEQQAWRRAYPAALPRVVVRDSRPVGSVLLDQDDETLLLVDIVLLPTERGRGVGTMVLRRLRAEAAPRRLRLHVSKNSRPFRWYARLGFRIAEETALHVCMELTPLALDSHGEHQ